MLGAMQSVEAILNKVYGGKAEAHAALGGSKSGPWNWAKAGHFPARIAIQVSLDAKARDVELPLNEIPTIDKPAIAQ